MRQRRSTATQTAMLLSVLLHGGALAGLLLSRAPAPRSAPEALQVYSYPEDQLEGLDVQLPPTSARLLPPTPGLSPAQVAALPRDAVPLPEHVPSPEALTEARGQIVELEDPLQRQKAPDDAQYLSRADHRVEVQSASRQYRVNPEVVAPTYSAERSSAYGSPGNANALLEGAPDLAPGAPAFSPRVALREPTPLARSQATELAPAAAQTLPTPARPSTPPAPAPPNPGGRPASPDSRPSTPEAAQQARVSPSALSHTGLEPSASDLPRHDLPTLELPAQPVPKREELHSSLSPLPASAAIARLSPALKPEPLPSRTAPSVNASATSGSESRVAMLVPSEVRGAGGGEGGSASVSARQGELKGAPSNDRLKETRGDATLLNAHEFKYFGYMQLIRRQVNFYWSQALDNVGQVSERVTRNEFTTVLNVTLDRQGNLQELTLVRGCGVSNFDEATLKAFRIAAPFPPPPEGLLNPSGQANLPEFSFTVTLSKPAPRYTGIDPRANVLFPGIMYPR